jgi:glycosyltransferase involved in cell wall biosynthesis
MAEASMFLLTSEHEGFGLVLLEAMSVGLPVISYACPTGPRDLITDGENGFLIQPNDEDGFVEKVCRLIEDGELRMKMSENALRTSENYQMEKIINMWMDLFHSLRDK